VWGEHTQQVTPIAECQISRPESCITREAGTALPRRADGNTAHSGEHLGHCAKGMDGSYAEFVQERETEVIEQARLTSCEDSEHICSLAEH